MAGSAQLWLTTVTEWLETARSCGEGWMEAEEHGRYRQMQSSARQRQYLSGHYLLRVMAGNSSGTDASNWLLMRGPHGAPMLRHRQNGANLFASLSHSGERLAAAISPLPIGIDVEAHRRPARMDSIAARVFSPLESDRLRQLAEPDKSKLFFRLWTTLEAFAKRDGVGIRSQETRRHLFRTGFAGDASAVVWQTDAFSLAIAGSMATDLQLRGIPDDATSSHWHRLSETSSSVDC
jgi:4'-phosphopantetheinyl transferase